MSTVAARVVDGASRDARRLALLSRRFGRAGNAALLCAGLRGRLSLKDFNGVPPNDRELFNMALTPCVSGVGLTLASARVKAMGPE
jgi:hypothetical protein